MKRILAISALMTLMSACNQADDQVFGAGGLNESKPVSYVEQGLGVGPNALDAQKSKPAANVVYSIEVIAKSGAKPCKGEIELELYTDFTLELPEFRIQCLSMSIDLAGILGGATGGGFSAGSMQNDAKGNLSSDGYVLKMAKVANATFDPPRPILIGPLIQNPGKYEGYEKTTAHVVTAKDTKTGQTLNSSGELTVEVLDVGTTFDNKYLKEPFDNVIHWEMRRKGFHNLDGSHGLLFERSEWHWNMRPIMLPRIEIEGDFGSMIASTNTSGSSGNLLGVMTIILEVKDYEIYD